MRILIVSPVSECREALAATLRDNGCTSPLLVANGAEAAALLGGAEDSDVDVVLIDADQPEHAPAVCRTIRDVDQLKDVPLLLTLRAEAERAYSVACSADASDFLLKPIQAPELLGRVRAAVRLKKELDECRSSKAKLVSAARELEEANCELQRLAIVDDLTGIANRRFFNRVLAQEWSRAAREGVPLSLILIDIDFFKSYNDRYGHPRGDECLRKVAVAMNSFTKRPGDHFARVGGEEFTAVLPRSGIEGAAVVAEALRKRVDDLKLEHAGSPDFQRVTVSMGVASMIPPRRSTPKGLMALVDEALYEAKRAGRNRVHISRRVDSYRDLESLGSPLIDAEESGPRPPRA